MFQLVVDRVPELDLKRTFVFTFLGLTFVGPTLTVDTLSVSEFFICPTKASGP